MVHAIYSGKAAGHINTVKDDYLISVNPELSIDVFSRSEQRKIKIINIALMRCSLVVEDLLFIGTEESNLHMLDAVSLEEYDHHQVRQSVFSICNLDEETVIVGQHKGFIEVFQV